MKTYEECREYLEKRCLPYIPTTALTCRGVRPNKRDSNAAVAEWFNDDESVGIGLIIDKGARRAVRGMLWLACVSPVRLVVQYFVDVLPSGLPERREFFPDLAGTGRVPPLDTIRKSHIDPFRFRIIRLSDDTT